MQAIIILIATVAALTALYMVLVLMVTRLGDTGKPPTDNRYESTKTLRRRDAETETETPTKGGRQNLTNQTNEEVWDRFFKQQDRQFAKDLEVLAAGGDKGAAVAAQWRASSRPWSFAPTKISLTEPEKTNMRVLLKKNLDKFRKRPDPLPDPQYPGGLATAAFAACSANTGGTLEGCINTGGSFGGCDGGGGC